MPPARAQAATAAIILPARPFILRRELERGLAGGATLLVAREWRGRFERTGTGIAVLGEQISATVEAPAVLAPIAAIERSRIAPGPFPAELDERGRIVGGDTVETSGKGAAVQAALALMERAGKPAATLAEARAYLDRLAEASGAIISETPADLFFPQTGEAHERRALTLPGGATGEVLVELQASAGPGGLLDCFDRRITTRIGNETRRSRETWRLRNA